ncbi:acyl carrier protein [Pseudomonas putida]|uniref:acyl carrier protein n=1 Tax=Pseudomonas putida TaxID=303 RepID=UPI0024E15644|nr:acyl carrier protein [Pseudomonas putida]
MASVVVLGNEGKSVAFEVVGMHGQSEMTQMIKLEVEAIIIAILANRLVVDVEFVTPNARLVADLGADSLNFLDINDLLGIELPPEGLACIRKVEDLYRLVHQAIAQAA